MSSKALVSHPSDKALSRYEHKINLGKQEKRALLRQPRRGELTGANPGLRPLRQAELRRLRHQQGDQHAEAEGRPHVGDLRPAPPVPHLPLTRFSSAGTE